MCSWWVMRCVWVCWMIWDGVMDVWVGVLMMGDGVDVWVMMMEVCDWWWMLMSRCQGSWKVDGQDDVDLFDHQLDIFILIWPVFRYIWPIYQHIWWYLMDRCVVMLVCWGVMVLLIGVWCCEGRWSGDCVGGWLMCSWWVMVLWCMCCVHVLLCCKGVGMCVRHIWMIGRWVIGSWMIGGWLSTRWVIIRSDWLLASQPSKLNPMENCVHFFHASLPSPNLHDLLYLPSY